jgi:hypothetical protein
VSSECIMQSVVGMHKAKCCQNVQFPTVTTSDVYWTIILKLILNKRDGNAWSVFNVAHETLERCDFLHTVKCVRAAQNARNTLGSRMTPAAPSPLLHGVQTSAPLCQYWSAAISKPAATFQMLAAFHFLPSLSRSANPRYVTIFRQ